MTDVFSDAAQDVSDRGDADDLTFSLPDPGERMAFTGERYVTGLSGNIQNEHYHRYLFALRLCQGKDVLDVASGEGYGSALLAQVARSVVGVDIHDHSITFADQAYGGGNLSFRSGSVLALPLEDSSVDVVVCFETIEHVSAHEALLDEVMRVLRKGGILLVSTPDRRVYTEEPDYHNPFHLKELDRGEFKALLLRRFPHVVLYEQQVIAGSVLSLASAKGCGTESFATEDGAKFLRKTGLPRAPYLIAVASSKVAVLPAASVLHGLPTDATGTLGTLPSPSSAEGVTPREVALQIENDELRGQLLSDRLNQEVTQRRLYEMDRDRGYLQAMLTGARRLADVARAEHIHSRATLEAHICALEDEAKAKSASARADAAAAKAEVASAKADIASALADASAARAETAAQLDIVRSSTSWRLTAPMRVIMSGFRRVLR